MKEDVFKHLKKTNGEPIDDTTKENWYKARKYVLAKLPEWERKVSNECGIHKDSDCHLHFAIKADELNSLTMSVLRHIALSAHYTNFREKNGENATIISIVCNKDKKSYIEKEFLLNKEEYLGNLYEICNEPYIDVKIRFKEDGKIPNGAEEIKSETIEAFCAEFKSLNDIDVTMAQYVNMVYNTGVDIDNLPPDDPNAAERYNLALDVFFYHKMAESQTHWDKIVGKDVENQYKIRNKLSNVYCADCFESRVRGVIANLGYDIGAKSISEYLESNETMDIIKEAMAKNLESIARCEHSRWIVEKLVLGFEPLGKEERMNYEVLFGKERSEYLKRLKTGKDPKTGKDLKKKRYMHIDLCSYNDLRRIDPGNMKYDCFLMLAVPQILEKCYIEEKNKK